MLWLHLDYSLGYWTSHSKTIFKISTLSFSQTKITRIFFPDKLCLCFIIKHFKTSGKYCRLKTYIKPHAWLNRTRVKIHIVESHKCPNLEKIRVELITKNSVSCESGQKVNVFQPLIKQVSRAKESVSNQTVRRIKIGSTRTEEAQVSKGWSLEVEGKD